MEPLLSSSSSLRRQASHNIVGKKLARKRKQITAHHLALLTADMVNGSVVVSHLTLAQARALTKASLGYASTASHLTPKQRQQVERGEMSLASFHNNREPSDAQIDRLVAKCPDRVMRALDRLTQPELPMMAAE
jgi:hypothetical protein